MQIKKLYANKQQSDAATSNVSPDSDLPSDTGEYCNLVMPTRNQQHSDSVTSI